MVVHRNLFYLLRLKWFFTWSILTFQLAFTIVESSGTSWFYIMKRRRLIWSNGLFVESDLRIFILILLFLLGLFYKSSLVILWLYVIVTFWIFIFIFLILFIAFFGFIFIFFGDFLFNLIYLIHLLRVFFSDSIELMCCVLFTVSYYFSLLINVIS